MDGFLNVYKESGMSSHDVVSKVRRIFGTKKVGHAGTLDPMAKGVLPVAIGQATRLIEYLAEGDKGYSAEILFGIKTDSGDLEGKIISRLDDFQMPSMERAQEAVRAFLGKIKQTPPVYSAIKINGKRAYELARNGENVDMPEREVEILSLNVTSVEGRKIAFDVECSKGTYVRTLCMDIGECLGIPSAMSDLVRTRVGKFKLEDAKRLDELERLKEALLIKADAMLDFIPAFELNEKRVRAFKSGLSSRIGTLDVNEGDVLRVYSKDVFLGIACYKNEEIFPQKVFA